MNADRYGDGPGSGLTSVGTMDSEVQGHEADVDRHHADAPSARGMWERMRTEERAEQLSQVVQDSV